MVSRLKEGGQSINILSYFFNSPNFSEDKISFKTKALFESLTHRFEPMLQNIFLLLCLGVRYNSSLNKKV